MALECIALILRTSSLRESFAGKGRALSIHPYPTASPKTRDNEVTCQSAAREARRTGTLKLIEHQVHVTVAHAKEKCSPSSSLPHCHLQLPFRSLPLLPRTGRGSSRTRRITMIQMGEELTQADAFSGVRVGSSSCGVCASGRGSGGWFGSSFCEDGLPPTTNIFPFASRRATRSSLQHGASTMRRPTSRKVRDVMRTTKWYSTLLCHPPTTS